MWTESTDIFDLFTIHNYLYHLHVPIPSTCTDTIYMYLYHLHVPIPSTCTYTIYMYLYHLHIPYHLHVPIPSTYTYTIYLYLYHIVTNIYVMLIFKPSDWMNILAQPIKNPNTTIWGSAFICHFSLSQFQLLYEDSMNRFGEILQIWQNFEHLCWTF